MLIGGVIEEAEGAFVDEEEQEGTVLEAAEKGEDVGT